MRFLTTGTDDVMRMEHELYLQLSSPCWTEQVKDALTMCRLKSAI
jgi:hypothetical protein